jgi:hypothetical protein
MKYRKKPIVIEAFRYGFHDEPDWCLRNPDVNHVRSMHDEWLEIETLEGTMTARFGDYVIKGIQGELYPCREDIFESTYEAVDEGVEG